MVRHGHSRRTQSRRRTTGRKRVDRDHPVFATCQQVAAGRIDGECVDLLLKRTSCSPPAWVSGSKFDFG